MHNLLYKREIVSSMPVYIATTMMMSCGSGCLYESFS